MVEKGAPALLHRHPAQVAPILRELLDPIELERRLGEARARRAVAMAMAGRRREEARASVARFLEGAGGTVPAPPQSDIARRPGLRRAGLLGVFITGLCLGAACAFVLVPAPMRARIVGAMSS